MVDVPIEWLGGSNESYNVSGNRKSLDAVTAFLIRAISYISLYYSPVVSMIGFVGNGIIIAVFIRKKAVRVSRNVRLLYLLIAVFDNGPLLSYHASIAFFRDGLQLASNGTWVIELERSRFMCKFLHFSLFFTEGVANGLVAFLAVERYVNIFRPFDASLRHKRSLWLLGCLLFMYLLVNLPLLHVFDLRNGLLSPFCNPPGSRLGNTLLFGANVVNVVLPCVAMLLCNLLCLLKLQRRKLLQRPLGKQRTLLSHIRSLRVLYWLSGTFLAINLPTSVALFVCESTGNLNACVTVRFTFLLSAGIHSVNVFVYWYHMGSFRAQLASCCGRTADSQSTSLQRAANNYSDVTNEGCSNRATYSPVRDVLATTL